jgi:transposase
LKDELIDYEWAAIKPMLPNKPRGVHRVNDRTAFYDGRPATPPPKSDGPRHVG